MQQDEYLLCLNNLLLESPLLISPLDDEENDSESNNEGDEDQRDDKDDENDLSSFSTLSNPKFRNIDALGRITLPTARSRFRRCAWCDIRFVASPSGGASSSLGQSSHPLHWKECTKCHSAIYCSPLCLDQDKKIGNHRSLCAQICRHKKRVSNLGLEYSESNNGVMDVFDWSNGMVFYFADPHRGLGTVGEQYIVERKALVDSLVKEGASKMVDVASGAAAASAVSNAFTDTIPPPHWNYMALELSLEHSLDILYLDPVASCRSSSSSSNANCIRTGIAHSLLVLERFQELYDYVKYWNVLPRKLRQMHRRPAEERDIEQTLIPSRVHGMLHAALGAETFMKTKKQSFFEDQRELVLRLPSRPPPMESDIIRTFPGPSMTEVVCVLYVALAKLLVLEKVKNVRMVVQNCIPIQAETITATIGSYLDLAPDWVALNTQTVLKQCRELLAFADNSIPGTLKTLIQSPDEIESSHYLNATDASPTSIELLRAAWFNHDLHWTFLVNFVEHGGACGTNIPRNDAIQQALDHFYSSYIELHTSDPEYLECRRHWNRVKNTEAVRSLLTNEVEKGRHLCGSGFYPTQMYLRLVTQVWTRDNFELLFGNPNVPYSVLRDVDMYLATEHLFQVKYTPEVLSFCKTNDIVIPDDACTCLVTLSAKDLATPENTTLLFGDDDRLGAWFLQ